jgi:hypothetical protein
VPQARLPKDKIILGAAGGDRGVRDFIVALDAATGQRRACSPSRQEEKLSTRKAPPEPLS